MLAVAAREVDDARLADWLPSRVHFRVKLSVSPSAGNPTGGSRRSQHGEEMPECRRSNRGPGGATPTRPHELSATSSRRYETGLSKAQGRSARKAARSRVNRRAT